VSSGEYVYASIDLGSTKAACAGPSDGKIRIERCLPRIDAGPQAVLARIAAVLRPSAELAVACGGDGRRVGGCKQASPCFFPICPHAARRRGGPDTQRLSDAVYL
jgi:hypothetical protein